MDQHAETVITLMCNKSNENKKIIMLALSGGKLYLREGEQELFWHEVADLENVKSHLLPLEGCSDSVDFLKIERVKDYKLEIHSEFNEPAHHHNLDSFDETYEDEDDGREEAASDDENDSKEAASDDEDVNEAAASDDQEDGSEEAASDDEEPSDGRSLIKVSAMTVPYLFEHRPLVEVISLKLHARPGRKFPVPGSYLSVCDVRHEQIIYRCDTTFRDTQDDIELALIGPRRSILCEEFLTFEIHNPNQEAYLAWEWDCTYEGVKGYLGKVCCKTFGPFDISFTLVLRALEKQVKVELQLSPPLAGGEKDLKVYGEITAHMDQFDERHQCVLFRQSRMSSVSIPSSSSILKLNRSNVIMSLDKSTEIKVRLTVESKDRQQKAYFEGLLKTSRRESVVNMSLHPKITYTLPVPTEEVSTY